MDLLNDQAAGEAWAFAAGRHPGKALHALRLAHHVSATLAAGTHPQHSQRHRRSDPLRLLRLHGLDDEFWEQLAGAVGEQGFVGLLGELEQAAGSGAGATGAGFCSAGVAFPLACLMRVLGVALEEHPAAQCSAALLQCGAFRAQLGRKLQEARRWVRAWLGPVPVPGTKTMQFAGCVQQSWCCALCGCYSDVALSTRSPHPFGAWPHWRVHQATQHGGMSDPRPAGALQVVRPGGMLADGGCRRRPGPCAPLGRPGPGPPA